MLEGISSGGDGQQAYSLGCSGSMEASNPDLPHPHPHPRMLTLPIPAGPCPLLPRPQRSTWLMRFQQRVDVTCLWNESRIKHSWHWGGLLNNPHPPAPVALSARIMGKGPPGVRRSNCSCTGQGRGYLGMGAPVPVDHDTVFHGGGGRGPVAQPRGGWPGS